MLGSQAEVGLLLRVAHAAPHDSRWRVVCSQKATVGAYSWGVKGKQFWKVDWRQKLRDEVKP